MKLLIEHLLLFGLFILIESKYEIILDRVEIPNEKESKVFGIHTCRVRKFNRSSAVLSGVYELKIPIDDSIIVSFEAFNFNGGQYKKLFSNTLGPTCQILYEKSVEKETQRYWEKINGSVPLGTCPIPAQYIKNFDWAPEDLGDFLPPYMPGNERWKLTLWFWKNSERLGGVTIFAILRDQQKLFDSKFG